MDGRHREPITGTAAGVPFTALPPTVTVQGPVPLVVTWHMMDAPCTDPAFAAALPMMGIPAWRVHLGMPLCRARMLEAGATPLSSWSAGMPCWPTWTRLLVRPLRSSRPR